MPAFMSKTPGPWSRPARDRERHPIELTDRPDSVEVAEEQDPRPGVAELRQNAVARRFARQDGRTRPPSLLEARCRLAAARVNGLLVR